MYLLNKTYIFVKYFLKMVVFIAYLYSFKDRNGHDQIFICKGKEDDNE